MSSARPTSFLSPSPQDLGLGVEPERAKSGIREPSWALWRIPEPAEAGNDGWARVSCPKCSPQDTSAATLRVHVTGVFLCARCGWHGDATHTPGRGMVPPTPFLPAWWRGDASEGALAPLAQALGLSTETLVHAEASISEAWFPERANTAGGWMRAIMLPCRERVDGPVVDVIAVAIDPSSDPWEHITRTPGGTAVPWGWDSADPGEVVFVDHPLDRLAMLESGVESVVCLPEALHPHGPQGGDWSILGHIEQDMAAIARVVLALRNDQSGHALEEEFARRVGRERCFRTRWSDVDVPHSTAGAWTVLRHHGRAALAEQIQTASPYPVAGVHELMDVDDRFEVLYEFGLSRGVSTGWPSLDPYYTVKPGQMTIVTGIPGHGKSNFLDALFVNLAREHAWVFGLFSPENQPIERHYAGLMEKYVGAPFDIGPTPRITIQEKNAAKSWLNSQFKVLLPDEDSGNWTIDGVLTLAKTLVYRYGIRGLIIDPWNELDHTRPSNVTETDHISASLTKIRRFARLNGVHVWVVAHPTKLEPRADGKYPVPTPYMISGGAHWRNKADNTITVYRNVGEDDDDIADIHIQKIRFKEIGRVGLVSLRCNIVCGRYVDDINQEKRRKALEKGVYIPSSDIRLPQPREYAPMRGLPLDFDGDGLPTSF